MSDLPAFPTDPPKGWVCPLCHTVYAPDVTSCSCAKGGAPARVPVIGPSGPGFPLHRGPSFPVDPDLPRPYFPSDRVIGPGYGLGPAATT